MYCLNNSFAFLAGGRGWEGMFCSVVLLKKKEPNLRESQLLKMIGHLRLLEFAEKDVHWFFVDHLGNTLKVVSLNQFICTGNTNENPSMTKYAWISTEPH